jgi:hypothetical protein
VFQDMLGLINLSSRTHEALRVRSKYHLAIALDVHSSGQFLPQLWHTPFSFRSHRFDKNAGPH